ARGRHSRHREVPRREDQRANGARVMDTLETVAFARALVDIDSTTGREQTCGEWLASELERRGYRVTRQAVADGRFNVYARLDDPVVVLSTHFDTVPPYFPSDVHDNRIWGR